MKSLHLMCRAQCLTVPLYFLPLLSTHLTMPAIPLLFIPSPFLLPLTSFPIPSICLIRDGERVRTESCVHPAAANASRAFRLIEYRPFFDAEAAATSSSSSSKSRGSQRPAAAGAGGGNGWGRDEGSV